jgi:integral membrane protein (TIGR01906 family)
LKIIGIIAKWVFILCLPTLLITASISLATNSLWLYKYGFDKYNVSATTGLTEGVLDKVAIELTSYFNSSDVHISFLIIEDGRPIELFNQRELSHLKDVKGLIWLNYWVLIGTLLYAISYTVTSLIWHRRRRLRQLAREVAGGSSLTLVLMLALGLGVFLGFDRLFLQFHLVSFANDFWQLDPTTDYLIMLFPSGFWYNAALFCVLATTAFAMFLGSLSGGYLIFTKGKVNQMT